MEFLGYDFMILRRIWDENFEGRDVFGVIFEEGLARVFAVYGGFEGVYGIFIRG